MTDSLCLYNTGIKQLWIYVYEKLNLVRKNFEERHQGLLTHIECLNISSVLGYHKTRSSLFAFNVAGISEGNESLITLMCGTHDDLDESPESIVNNSCTVDHLS